MDNSYIYSIKQCINEYIQQELPVNVKYVLMIHTKVLYINLIVLMIQSIFL